jgi:hypothetical protein
MTAQLSTDPHTRACARCSWHGTWDTRDEANTAAADHAQMSQHWQCVVCCRSLPPELEQTCYGCVARVRAHILASLDMFAYLPLELASSRPDLALAILTPGSAGTAYPRKDWPVPLDLGYDESYNSAPLRSPQHGMNLMSDPESPASTFGQWEDDWRGLQAQPAAEVAATMTGTTTYLLAHLSWAAQNHPAWVDFVDDVRRIHRHLEDATAHGERVDRSDAPCLDCDQTALRRAFAPPLACDHQPAAFGWWHRLLQRQWFEWHVGPDGRGCDQGGLREVWVCGACGRRYEPEEYWLAVRQRYANEQAAAALEAHA